MQESYCIDGSEIFDENSLPINVRIAEHRTGGKQYHSHLFYEFVYIDRGFSTHYYNETTSLLTPGDVFGIRPGDVHGYIYPKNTILYNCLFKAEALQSEIERICELPGVCLILGEKNPSVWKRVHLDPIKRKYALDYLDSMIIECETKDHGWELKLKSLLIEFLILFSRAYVSGYTTEESGEYIYAKYIYKALANIENNFDHAVMIEDIAYSTGLSTDYFSRMFRQFTGFSPLEYIKNVRLAKAVELLSRSDMSVSEVAEKVGFEDPGYFARQFKQTLGMSPSTYQKEKTIKRY